MKKLMYILFLILSVFLILPFSQAEASSSAKITDLRWKTRNDGNPPFVRIVMDLSSSIHAEAAIDDSGKNFEVALKNTKVGNAKHDYQMDPSIMNLVTVSQQGSDTHLDIDLKEKHSMKDIKVFGLKPDAKAHKPHRLVVDIPYVGGSSSAAVPSKTVKPAAVPETNVPKVKNYDVSDEAKKALRGKIIVIDPGHGGTDVGAIGHLDGQDIYEKNVTLSIAIPLRDMLTSAGAKVIMTRSTDRDVYGPYSGDVEELQARCDVANNANADAFVSIHIDSFANSSVDGTTTYYYPKSDKDLLLAQMMHQATINGLYISDRGVRSNDFYVNVHTNMPSVLMEMGFITNQHRLAMLTSNWGPKSIAQSLFNGLVAYFNAL